MSFEGIQPLTLVIAGSVFALIVVLWVAGVCVWSMRKASRSEHLENRLAGSPLPGAQPGKGKVLNLWRDGGVASTVVAGDTTPKTMSMKFRVLAREAGYKSELPQIMMMLFGSAAAVGILVFLLSHNIIGGVLGFIAIPGGFYMYTKGRVAKRAVVFEKQFIGALDLASRSLRAGHPLLGAFHLIAEELDPPVSTVFAEICQQHGLGVSLEEAIQRATLANNSPELRLFATSVAVQLRSGGNLAEMMERVAAVIRERARLSRRVRILTAQTQMSKHILVALPIIMFLLLNVISPDYMITFYTEFTGKVLLALAAGIMMLGVVAMNRMAVIKY